MESAADRRTGIEPVSPRRKRAGTASGIALHFKKGHLHAFAGKEGASGKPANACADNDAMQIANIHGPLLSMGLNRLQPTYC
jgi:hypothetical protein